MVEQIKNGKEELSFNISRVTMEERMDTSVVREYLSLQHHGNLP